MEIISLIEQFPDRVLQPGDLLRIALAPQTIAKLLLELAKPPLQLTDLFVLATRRLPDNAHFLVLSDLQLLRQVQLPRIPELLQILLGCRQGSLTFDEFFLVFVSRDVLIFQLRAEFHLRFIRAVVVRLRLL